MGLISDNAFKIDPNGIITQIMARPQEAVPHPRDYITGLEQRRLA